jgi:Zn-dependent protease with chaperone function
MIVLAALPFVVGILLAANVRRLSGWLPPAAATWLLTGLALTVALTCGLVLSAAAVLSVAQLPVAARAGRWSADALRDDGSPPVTLGVATSLVVLLLLGAAVLQALRTVRAMLAARAAVRSLPDARANLVIVHDDDPTAYAVGGAAGRIVVSTGMLHALSAGERRVLLAHEAAHLRCRHHLFVQLTDLAAAANPLMRPVSAAVRCTIERWADEAAAREVGDRRLAARGLARAALSRSAFRPPAPALGIADADVPARVQALLAPPPILRWNLRLGMVAAGLVCWAAAAMLSLKAHELLEIAQSVRPH